MPAWPLHSQMLVPQAWCLCLPAFLLTVFTPLCLPPARPAQSAHQVPPLAVCTAHCCIAKNADAECVRQLCVPCIYTAGYSHAAEHHAAKLSRSQQQQRSCRASGSVQPSRPWPAGGGSLHPGVCPAVLHPEELPGRQVLHVRSEQAPWETSTLLAALHCTACATPCETSSLLAALPQWHCTPTGACHVSASAALPCLPCPPNRPGALQTPPCPISLTLPPLILGTPNKTALPESCSGPHGLCRISAAPGMPPQPSLLATIESTPSLHGVPLQVACLVPPQLSLLATIESPPLHGVPLQVVPRRRPELCLGGG